jgi:leucyl/phenylalanyl-tRNA--protein transferase
LESRAGSRSLDPGFLLEAYRVGFFPMADPETGEISWYSPDPRAIISLPKFHVSRSLRRTVRRERFAVRINQRFDEVLRACASRPETWISPEVISAYGQLHQAGFAHSVEAWEGGRLAGGLYGVSMQGAFFGESMFSRATDASKVALVHLVERLRARGFVLLDVQFMTPHLAGLGAVEVARPAYLKLLERALRVRTSFDP